MIAISVATVAAGLFAGAAMYITVVEHPARVECGQALAIKEFGPSYRCAAVMQGVLAVVGLLANLIAWYQGFGLGWLIGWLLLATLVPFTLVPFTLVVVIPTNRRLLDPGLDSGSGEAGELLTQWGQLHAMRTVVSVAVFRAFVGMSVRS
jgi:hypothetical protein